MIRIDSKLAFECFHVMFACENALGVSGSESENAACTAQKTAPLVDLKASDDSYESMDTTENVGTRCGA